MKKSILNLFVLLAGIATLVSCKKYKEEFYGPGMGLAPDDFNASSIVVSDANPNFKIGTVSFQSDLSATVRWKLTLTGQTSGAVKFITGLSNSINSSNAVWDGSTDTVKLFKKGETVEVKLTALGWKESISSSFTIGEVKDRGLVLGTFENISVNHPSRNWLDASGYYWFYSFETGEYDLVDKLASTAAPEGSYSLFISGHDADESYYIGQVGLTAPSPGVFNLGTINNVDDVYFNFYVKGCGSDASKDYKFVVQVFEDDDNNGTVDYNNQEDKYTYEMSLKYDGWKFYSVKYTSFILDSAVLPTSDRNYTPSRIANIGFYFGAKTQAGLSATEVIKVEMDHFSITSNGPMIP